MSKRNDYEQGLFDFNRLQESEKETAIDGLVLCDFDSLDWITGDVVNVKEWRRGFNAAADKHQKLVGG
jgi:hypothetical protein